MVKDFEEIACPDDCTKCARQYKAFDPHGWCQERNLVKRLCKDVEKIWRTIFTSGQSAVTDAGGNIVQAEMPPTGLRAEISTLQSDLAGIGRLASDTKGEVDLLREQNAALLERLEKLEARRKLRERENT